jgi:hypothetical protein
VVAERGAVPDDEGVHLRPGESHVHPPQVGEEAEPPLRVAADTADQHRLGLAALKGVDGVHLDAQRLERGRHPRCLRAVGSDDGDLPGEQTGAEQRAGAGDDDLGLARVLEALAALGRDLLPPLAGRVEKEQGRSVELRSGKHRAERASGDRGMGAELAAVESAGGKLHQLGVHPVLLAEHLPDRIAVEREQALEEADAEPARGGLLGQDGGRELPVVAGEHHAVGAEKGEQGERLGGLGRLVHEGEREPERGERSAAEGGERRADHVGALEHVPDRLPLQRPCLVHQGTRLGLRRAGVGEPLAAPSSVPLLPGVAEELEGVVEQLPREFPVGMVFHLDVEGVLDEAR